MTGATRLLLIAGGCTIRDVIVGSRPDPYLEGTRMDEVIRRGRLSGFESSCG